MWDIGPKFSQMWRIGTKFSNVWRIRAKSSHLWKIVSNRRMWKNLYKTLTCEELVPNLQTFEMLVPNYQRCEELVLYCHRWQWQNGRIGIECKIHQGLGVFFQREEYACMLYEIWLCAYFLQSERFWYGKCGVLVPIFHVQVRYY